jgi:hypothetical protein
MGTCKSVGKMAGAASSAKIKNAWNYTSIHPVCFHYVELGHRDSLSVPAPARGRSVGQYGPGRRGLTVPLKLRPRADCDTNIAHLLSSLDGRSANRCGTSTCTWHSPCPRVRLEPAVPVFEPLLSAAAVPIIGTGSMATKRVLCVG